MPSLRHMRYDTYDIYIPYTYVLRWRLLFRLMFLHLLLFLLLFHNLQFSTVLPYNYYIFNSSYSVKPLSKWALILTIRSNCSIFDLSFKYLLAISYHYWIKPSSISSSVINTLGWLCSLSFSSFSSLAISLSILTSTSHHTPYNKGFTMITNIPNRPNSLKSTSMDVHHVHSPHTHSIYM